MKKSILLSRYVAAGVVAVMMLTSSVYAADTTVKTEETTTKRVINYKEAVKMAIDNNSSLKTLVNSVELMESSKEDTVSSLGGVSRGGDLDQITVIDANILSTLTAIDGLDARIKNSRLSKDVTEKLSEYTVKSTFTGIINAEKDLEILKEKYKLDMKNFEDAQTKYSLGMISTNDIAKMRSEIDSTKLTIDSTELSIKNVYTGLNKLLGLKPDDVYDIEYDVELVPFNMNTDLETYIGGKVASDPSIKMNEASISSAKFALNAYSTSGGDSYEQKQFNLKDAELKDKDARKDMAENMRNTYNQLKQNEIKQKTLEADLKQAESDFAVAKTNLEIGNITQLTCDQAALAVENAKQAIQKNIYAYDSLKFTLENPFLASSGAGTSEK